MLDKVHIIQIGPNVPGQETRKYSSSCLFGPIVDELMPFDRISVLYAWLSSSSRVVGGDENPYTKSTQVTPVICTVFVGEGSKIVQEFRCTCLSRPGNVCRALYTWGWTTLVLPPGVSFLCVNDKIVFFTGQEKKPSTLRRRVFLRFIPAVAKLFLETNRLSIGPWDVGDSSTPQCSYSRPPFTPPIQVRYINFTFSTIVDTIQDVLRGLTFKIEASSLFRRMHTKTTKRTLVK